ncbi:DnaA regulatory inactivator Hda [Luteimonas viscosa]|uniref:DnaA regulatory inactivator Hda n=1 Tax=Luteimonas viscosa TaxID=1132694 RepID=A0A5D4XQT5_9GAMM|nr:DnaA regulatory inactivator Hda [Luteimonas viscosa]TYT26929.1 DnaA regulatory inactivator Hda [Luteimonas viscosa]
MPTSSPQLPLALRYPPDQRLDTFAGDPALAAQLRAFASGGDDRALLLAGPAGTGKSHLALAACAEADAAGHRVGYLPLASMAGRLREALEAMHAFDLVALDGVEAVSGQRADELALFDFHNRMHDAGRRLLYTARATPDALPLVLPDLRSRLSQCTRLVLERLDDAGRGEVLRLRARRRGLQIDDAAIDWLLRRAGRDLSGLAALLDRLDAASLAAQRRITVPFLREVLGTDGSR